MNDPLTQFELLLEAGKLEEAKKMIHELVNRELTKEEEAAAKVLQARLYIKLTNAINQAYLDTLTESIEQLKMLNAKERELEDKVKLAKTRAELQS